jgi:hypothetical protein
MNLYPLRARLPHNLAGVEDRMRELSFGNRMRQDHDAARRINALVETIDALAEKIAPDDRSDWLNARLDEARRYKIIDAIVNVDMQDPGATLVPSAQNPADDKDGNAGLLARYRAPPPAGRIQIRAEQIASCLREPVANGTDRCSATHKIAAGKPKLARRAQRSALDNSKPQ